MMALGAADATTTWPCGDVGGSGVGVDLVRDLAGGEDRGTGPSSYDKIFGRNRFARLIQFATKQETFQFQYNGAALAKLAMAPLWKEILDKIMPRITVSDPSEEEEEAAAPLNAPKLALFSGHDSTLMPLLSTLGPNVYGGS